MVYLATAGEQCETYFTIRDDVGHMLTKVANMIGLHQNESKFEWMENQPLNISKG